MLNDQFTSIVHPTPGWHHVRISTNGNGLLWLHERGFEACYQQPGHSLLSFAYVPCSREEIRAQWRALLTLRLGNTWTQERQEALWRISLLRRSGDIVATITPRWLYVDHGSDRIRWQLLIGLDYAERPLPAATLALLELVRDSDREYARRTA